MRKFAAVFPFAILSLAALSGCVEINALDPGNLEVHAHVYTVDGTVSGKGHAQGFDFDILSAITNDEQDMALCDTIVTRTDDPIVMPVGTPLVLLVNSSGDYQLSTFVGNRPPGGNGDGSADHADAGPSFSLSGTFSHIKIAP
jgi:hypothetical protein